MHKYTWHLAGHNKQRLQLENDINSDSLSHAYLFYGPSEVGKFTLAKTFANILQCNNGLCGKCAICKQIDNDSHYDSIVMRNDGSTIKIKEVMDLIARLSKTSQSNYKIILIEDIERMTLPASNAILKTLEEPSDDTIFLLTTNDITKVLDTIKSRLRLVKFSSVSNLELEEYLKEKHIVIDDEIKKMAETFAFGSIGKFFRLIKNHDDLDEMKELYAILLNMLENRPIAAQFKFIKTISEDKIKSKKTLEMLTHIIRSMMLSKVGYSSHLNESPELLNSFSNEHLLNMLESIESARQDLEKNINTKLLLENLFLQIKN